MASTSLANKRQAIKRALVHHLQGFGNETGLIYKSIERLRTVIEGNDDTLALAAIDKVVKLLPYVIEREMTAGSLLPGPNGSQILNIQINNFDTFLKDRLSHTNLGKLLNVNELAQSAEVIEHIETQEPKHTNSVGLTPPPDPGTAP